jgi:predicted dehydrogenase
MSENKLKVLLIGCGPHATHFYIPAFMRYGKVWNAAICYVVDLDGNQDRVHQELGSLGLKTKVLFVSPSGFETLNDGVSAMLDGLVNKNEVNAVIICTDPLNHKNYVKWALSRNLPLLMDKPVTSREQAVDNIEQAEGILGDYDELLMLYKQQAQQKPFVLVAHRRYHPGILFARDIIREVAVRTGCPVTNIHSAHSDGQWRLPYEICTQKHHSYNQGHGKVSHSGFHFIDCVEKFWEEGLKSGKSADDVEVFSSFVRPRGLLQQLTREDYEKLFGVDYNQICPRTDAELFGLYGTYGEVDAEISLAMRSQGEPFSLASISLVHNGFSQRSWMPAGKDLYKGNGRVKHEQHTIHMGPFASIQIHSYQSKDIHETCTQADDEPGGNNHYEIYVFRNTKMIGGKPFELLSLSDLPGADDFTNDRLYITQVKERSIEEWVSAIHHQDQGSYSYLSAFTDHRMSVSLMSAIYKSYIQKAHKGNPVCVVPWTTA